MPHLSRYESAGKLGDHLRLDLALAAPDPRLLPELAGPLTAALGTPRLHSYQRELVTPALDDAARRDWPFDPSALIAVSGGDEGVLLACQAQIIAGDRVAVEEPTAARLLDILELFGAEVLPVACDELGPRPDELAAVLNRKPVLFLYQPRGHTPCGHAVTAARRNQLAC